MNKEELLKAIEQKRQAIWPTDTGEMAPATVPTDLEQGWLNALKWMENLINSLPAEHTSEELEYLATSLEETIGTSPHSRETIISYLQQAAQWQKEQMMKNCLYDTEVMLRTKQNNTEYLTLAKDKMPHIPVSLGLNVGDKVKVIIVK